MSGAHDLEGLQPQDLVLTIVGAHVRRPGEMVWSGGMVAILEGFGFTTGAARAALARLVNRDLLARTRAGRRALYSPTVRAEALLAEGDRRIFSFGRDAPASERWTVVWHAIPDSRRVQRARFAARLRFLGFGTVQDATWVAARDREADVLALLRALELEEFASLMVGRPSKGAGPAALVAQAWPLEETGQRYATFLQEFGGLRASAARRACSDAAAFHSRTLLLHRFRAFPFVDPELPARIDPLAAVRSEAVACFDEVYGGLRDAARRHFWSVAGGSAGEAPAG